MITLERKTRYDCTRFAPCGKISLYSCHKYKGALVECSGCNLRKYQQRGGVVVGGQIMRRCTSCGKLLPVNRFNKRTIRHPNGKVYHTRESTCGYCKSRKYKRKKREKTKFFQETRIENFNV